MRKKYLGEIVYIIAMLLIIFSRIFSGKGFDWFAIVASILILIALIKVYFEYNKTK